MAVTINGTNGIAVPLGTAAAPAETNTTSSTTGIYYPTSTTLGLSTNGTNAVTIDASQNVGIGTTSPTSFGSTSRVLQVQSSDATGYGSVLVGSGTYTMEMLVNQNSGVMSIGSRSNHNLGFATNDTVRATIDTSGNLLVGTTTNNARMYGVNTTNTPCGRFDTTLASGYTSEAFQVVCAQPSSTGFKVAAFYINNAAAYAAYIRGDGTIFAQSTTIQAISDERTKENIVSSNDGLNVISALRPVRFDFKEGFGNGKQNQLGFIAQEMEQVFPEAVDEWGESDDPNKPYKSIGTGALIPVLVKAIQELSAEVEALKAKVGA